MNSRNFLCVTIQILRRGQCTRRKLETILRRPVSTSLKGEQKTRGEYQNDKRTKKDAILDSVIDFDKHEFSDLYQTAHTFNKNKVPLPIRMGRHKDNKVGPSTRLAYGNTELLKLPNFFHLTPPAIKKHCEALKEYCTPWPRTIGNKPIRITTINYLYSGPSIRYPKSNRVKLQICLGDLELDDHSRKKLIQLVGDRYNEKTDELTIITDSCPTRKQNKEYAFYLLTCLYHEAWKTEDWELDVEGKTEKNIMEEIETVNAEMNPRHYEEKKRTRRFYKVVGEKVVRFNRTGHPFVVESRRYGLKGGLTPEEIADGKKQWSKIQKNLPDNSTFDPLFERNKIF